LCLWVTADGLFFTVVPETRKGRIAIQVARRFPDLRQASVGINMREFRTFEKHGVTHCVVTRASLREISLVEEGACPNVWVEVE
jgi:hypothetical protein